MAARSSSSWRRSASGIAARCCSQCCVLPSISVKSSVTVPVGRGAFRAIFVSNALRGSSRIYLREDRYRSTKVVLMTLPSLFIGHGNPMNALEANYYTRAWAAIGARLEQATAILCISAHWYLPRTLVTAMEKPRTIHDFGGFPAELFEVEYAAPGSPHLARTVQSALAPFSVDLDRRWGLDHGTWSILVHMRPRADIPVLQLSIDETQAAAFHYELGKRLAPLRDEGVLIIGSGNIVHNLERMVGAPAYRSLSLGCPLRERSTGTHPCWTPPTPDRIFDPRQRCDALRSDARPLSAAALRSRCAPRQRTRELLGGGVRRRLNFDAFG